MPKLCTKEPVTRYQRSTRTKKISLKGREMATVVVSSTDLVETTSLRSVMDGLDESVDTSLLLPAQGRLPAAECLLFMLNEE